MWIISLFNFRMRIDGVFHRSLKYNKYEVETRNVPGENEGKSGKIFLRVS